MVQLSVAMVTTHDSVSVVVLRHLRIGKSFRWRLSLWAKSQFTTVSDDIAGLRQFSGCRSSLCLTISYLVDPASSHMLVSKIKPCMSKYKLLYGETANGSLKQLSSP